MEILRQHRQAIVDAALIKANKKRISYDYTVNQLVLKQVRDPTKLGPQTTGPYKIVQVHTNGTVTIQLDELTQERISIRKLRPYRSSLP